MIILYCGDFDSTGDWLDEYLVNAIEYYTGWKHHEEFEFIRVAVSLEHIEEYDLIEDPEYNPELNGDPSGDCTRKFDKLCVLAPSTVTTKPIIPSFSDLAHASICDSF